MSNRIDRVVITGTSSGIGFDMARRFLAEGSQVLLNARDPKKLEAAGIRRRGRCRRAGLQRVPSSLPRVSSSVASTCSSTTLAFSE